MIKLINRRLRHLYNRLRWPIRRRSEPKLIVKKLVKSSISKSQTPNPNTSSAAVHPNGGSKSIRVATFNAALFSMAPAVPTTTTNSPNEYLTTPRKSLEDRPKSILKHSPLHPMNLTKQQKFAKSKLRVSINLPDNEISLKSRQMSFREDEKEKNSLRSTVSFNASVGNTVSCCYVSNSRTVVDVLRELDADILALQDVKAEEEKGMKPLSDLAAALGMNYVFAESWAPEYGNAVLSKWPIKHSKVHKIFDDSDFRNVLKATIDVPEAGEVNFQCTHLDHLDENWRMKQINSIIQSNDGPHILAGGLNSLDERDYSAERWTDIVKYYEEMGKPTPKVEVMKFLNNKQYTDAKDFAGEYEPVVMIAKGQSVQGTCKYGTRVDYIVASPNSPYKFVPGSYSVLSSKGTSDHHIVKVDITKVEQNTEEMSSNARKRRQQHRQRVVKITAASSTSKGIWKAEAHEMR